MDFVSYKDFSKEIPKGTIGKIRINVYDWPEKGTQFIVLNYEYIKEDLTAFLKILADGKIWTIDLMHPNEILLLTKKEE